jgi:hypothetical protein
MSIWGVIPAPVTALTARSRRMNDSRGYASEFVASKFGIRFELGEGASVDQLAVRRTRSTPRPAMRRAVA